MLSPEKLVEYAIQLFKMVPSDAVLARKPIRDAIKANFSGG